MSNNIILFLVLVFITVGCENKNEIFNEIKYFSNINIPQSSSIIIYDDDLESNLAFKIYIEKEELYNFLKVNSFKPFDLSDKRSFTKTSSDRYLINEIKNSFSPIEKIDNKNLQILRINKKGTFVVDSKTSELWGLIDY